MIRCKFYVASKILHNRVDGGGTVILQPVIGDSPENKEFFKWTPSGEIKVGTINQAAFDGFVMGAQFYVDFTPAESAGG
ncbi:MAG: hypothetical protein ACKVT1_01220 [Dehalococcoidia bacterium]